MLLRLALLLWFGRLVMKKVLLTMLTTNSTTPTTSVIEKKDDLSVYGHTYLSP